MRHDLFATTTFPLEYLSLGKTVVTVVLLVLFWTWETWSPFFERREGRVRHAGHNIALAVFNTVLLAVVFGTATVAVAGWAEDKHYGLLHAFDIGWPLRFAVALVLLDGWMYAWHRANHTLPLLWRFHRMHHSDDRMDVTTATRFHLGEHVGSSVLRLGLIPLLGFQVWQLLVYETLVVAVTMFHHANISLGRWDGGLRWFIVTPYMHKVHHSRWRPETNSNYSTLLSVWDRLAGTYRTRPDPKTIAFGLDEFSDPGWQTFWGMLRTPFVSRDAGAAGPPGQSSGRTPGHDMSRV